MYERLVTVQKMADLTFMQSRYPLKFLLGHFLVNIKKLKPYCRTNLEKENLKRYFEAVKTIKNTTIPDLINFALSYGRTPSPKMLNLRRAFPTMLGYDVPQPMNIDFIYAKLLLEYAQEFKVQRHNVKEWTIRFLVSSRFSPLKTFIDNEIDKLIESTKANLTWYELNKRKS